MVVVALLYAIRALDSLKTENDDQRVGVDIVRRALKVPVRQIADNSGEEGSVVVGKLMESRDVNIGYNAQIGEYGNMFDFVVLDPTKVVRIAIQDAASVSSLLVTTEAIVAEKVEKKVSPGMSDMGGMSGMGGNDDY